jgi:hypothetical protein
VLGCGSFAAVPRTPEGLSSRSASRSRADNTRRSRTEDHVSVDLRRTVNQLYQLLLRYYPQLLQICPTPDEPWIWTLPKTWGLRRMVAYMAQLPSLFKFLVLHPVPEPVDDRSPATEEVKYVGITANPLDFAERAVGVAERSL